MPHGRLLQQEFSKKGEGGFFTTLEPAFVAALACFVPSALSSGDRFEVSPYFFGCMILAPYLLLPCRQCSLFESAWKGKP